MVNKVHPTQERLKELFDYNQETGNFIRNTSGRGANYSIGAVVGSKDNDGYLVFTVDGILYQAHRLAWIYMNGDISDGLLIDHMNGVKDDNRICNLRLATKKQNCQNQRNPSSNNTSGFLGVCFHKSTKKFQAKIKVDGKDKYLGLFTSPQEAHQAYLEAKRKFHEFGTI